MSKKNLILTLLCCSSFIFCGQSQASEKSTSLQMCKCYDTPVIGVEDFVKDDKGGINSVTTSCKENFFVTSVTQSPEKDPAQMGQFLITSTVRCCKVCMP